MVWGRCERQLINETVIAHGGDMSVVQNMFVFPQAIYSGTAIYIHHQYVIKHVPCIPHTLHFFLIEKSHQFNHQTITVIIILLHPSGVLL